MSGSDAFWGASHTDSFRYARVSWPTFEESGDIPGVTACTVEENALSALKAGGSISFVGSLGLGDDMVRVYSTSRNDIGESVEVCHGTFLAESDSEQFGGAASSGTANLYSILKVLQDWKTDETLVVPAGANPVEHAAEICRSTGLRVDAVQYAGALGNDAVYDFDTSMLTVVNNLLDRAGYASASADETGSVVMRPYVEPSDRVPAAKVSERGGAFLVSPVFRRAMDTGGVYNVVTFVGTDDEGRALRAQAVNDSKTSRWSTVSRGRIVSYNEQVQEPVGSAAQLQRKADNKLRSSMMAVETVEISHTWQDFGMGDALEMEFPSRGVEATYSAVKRVCSMTPGMPCTTTARRFVSF